jgi:hypothetical protein
MLVAPGSSDVGKGTLIYSMIMKCVGNVKVGDDVDSYSIADDCFSGNTVPRRPTRVDASCWLAWGYKNEATILEESRGLTSYDAVLTLLHIDQDIEPEWEPQESFTPDGRYRRR